MLVFVILLIVLLLFVFMRRKNEDFKILGALGNQKDLYYRCMSECEKSDPAKQLTPTKGSWMCKQYCDSVITDITRRGGPSYPRDLPVASASAPDSSDLSYSKCGDGTKGAWCRRNVYTAEEIKGRCGQDCQYSSLPTDMCMKQCFDSLKSRRSLGSWKWG